MNDEPSIPVYATALSDASDGSECIGRADSKSQAARLIRAHLRCEQGDPNPDVPASAVIYARGGYWIDD